MLGVAQGGRSAVLARRNYRLCDVALDFKQQQYLFRSSAFGKLALMPGYVFTDSVDNLPNITAAGYASLTAETSRLAVNANPYTADTDFVMWAAFQSAVAPAGSVVIVGLGNLNWFGLDVNGNLNFDVGVAAGFAYANGRLVAMIRRKAGKWSIHGKLPNGTVSIGAETALAFPAWTAKLEPGAITGAAQPNRTIEGIFARPGTFTDAQVTALLQAA